MQGHLRKQYLAAEIETRCRQSSQALHIMVDSELNISVRESDSRPLVFMPNLDWDHFSERTIIDSY